MHEQFLGGILGYFLKKGGVYKISNIKNQKVKRPSRKATTMADLMKSHQTSIPSVKKGEIVTGTITKLTSAEILVDINAKTEALVLEKDKNILKNILSTLKAGDSVQVSILNPESDFGNPVVSLRRYIDDKLWDRMADIQKTKLVLDARILEGTRGGFLVETEDGISGFLPNSHTQFLDVNSQNLYGKLVKVILLELNRPTRKIIFSQKAMGSLDFEKIIKGLKIDQKIDSTISNIAPFGVFTTLQIGEKIAEGFVHVSEISWEKLDSIPPDFKVGQKIETLIIGFDKNASRVNLSIKRLHVDPNIEKLESFVPEQKVTGRVSKVLANGVLLDLPDGIEGIIKKEKIPVGTSYTVGSELSATVSEVDRKRHRVVLVPILKEKPIGYR